MLVKTLLIDTTYITDNGAQISTTHLWSMDGINAFTNYDRNCFIGYICLGGKTPFL